MNLTKLYQSKHELWLKVLFTSFAINDEKLKNTIYEFAMIEFRHLKWFIKYFKREQYSHIIMKKYAIDFGKKNKFSIFLKI